MVSLNAFHILWSKPSIAKGNKPYFSKAELLTMAISAAMWRKYNGKIKLYTDKEGVELIKKFKLDDLYDAGVDTHTLSNNDANIDPEIFWAAGKLIALNDHSCPCVMLDHDLIVTKNIKSTLLKSEICALHPESLNPEVYLNPSLLKKPVGYSFPDEFDFSVLPANTALLFIRDKVFKDSYLKHSFQFIVNNDEKSFDSISQMVFAEQRMLSIVAKLMKKQLDFIIDDPFSKDNQTIEHLWGYKEIIRTKESKHDQYISSVLNRFYGEVRNFDCFNMVLEKLFL